MPVQSIDETAIIKSIEYEVRNYTYWNDQHKMLSIREKELLSRMYEVKAISHETFAQTSVVARRDHILVNWIMEKEELYEQLSLIETKKDFVDKLLEVMEEKDRNFIVKALVERKYYDTNDAVAMKLELTESGVRYKVDAILRKAMKKLLSKKED